LIVHYRTHTGEKPYHCAHCSKRFATIGNKNDHERRHTKTKPYVCDDCGISYYRHYQLTRHSKSKHSGPTKMITKKKCTRRNQPKGKAFTLKGMS